MKKYILLWLLTLKAEDNMKKSFHYYVGFVSRFVRQDKETSCFVLENQEPKIPTNEEDMKKDGSKPLDPLYIIYSASPSQTEYVNLVREACQEATKKHVFTHGFLFSIFLGEMFELVSFGLCVGNENWREDSVTFQPKTGMVEKIKDTEPPTEIQANKTNKQKKNKSSKKESKNLEIEETGILTFKRQFPLKAGIFVQIQNEDLDNYSLAARLNLMVGLINIYGIIKDPESIIDKNLTEKKSIFLTSGIALSASLSFHFRYQDLEGLLIVGCSWMPRGINVKRQCVSPDDQDEIITSEIKSNHFHLFVGIGLGFLFD